MRISSTLPVFALVSSLGCQSPASPPASDSGLPPTDAAVSDAGPDDGRPRARTTGGDVIGVEDMEAGAQPLHVFRAIPYAAPPVGALRFARPAPHPGWSEPLDTTTLAHDVRCPQRDARAGDALVGQEDCLVLNVFAPADAVDAPVMVFIHGGAFVQGAGTLGLYDGRALARRGVVVITLNYRVGTLGFLATDALVDAGDGGAGNFGLHDQLLALEWVRDNARAFGGDPDAVTIFGESACAVSVEIHVASPRSAGLFARAIAQSGGGGLSVADPQPDALLRGAEIADALGCAPSDLACLRSDTLSLAALVDAASSGPLTGLGTPNIGPHVDGVIVVAPSFERVRDGLASDVPFMIGSNADEALTFTRATSIPTEAAFRTALGRIFAPAIVDALIALYPASAFGDSWKSAYDALFGEIAFNCPALALTDAASDGAPAFAYHFTWRLRGAEMLGSFHGLELFYVFGNLGELPRYTPGDADHALIDAMQSAWVSFATTGAPSLEPSWAAYDASAPQIAIFDSPPSVETQIRAGRCAELTRLGLIPAP